MQKKHSISFSKKYPLGWCAGLLQSSYKRTHCFFGMECCKWIYAQAKRLRVPIPGWTITSVFTIQWWGRSCCNWWTSKRLPIDTFLKVRWWWFKRTIILMFLRVLQIWAMMKYLHRPTWWMICWICSQPTCGEIQKRHSKIQYAKQVNFFEKLQNVSCLV